MRSACLPVAGAHCVKYLTFRTPIHHWPQAVHVEDVSRPPDTPSVTARSPIERHGVRALRMGIQAPAHRGCGTLPRVVAAKPPEARLAVRSNRYGPRMRVETFRLRKGNDVRAGCA